MIHPHDVTTIAAYALGGLEPPEAATVEEHLVLCARCRAELDALSDPVGLLKSVSADLVLGDPSLAWDAKLDDRFGAHVSPAGSPGPHEVSAPAGTPAFDDSMVAEMAADLRALADRAHGLGGEPDLDMARRPTPDGGPGAS